MLLTINDTLTNYNCFEYLAAAVVAAVVTAASTSAAAISKDSKGIMEQTSCFFVLIRSRLQTVNPVFQMPTPQILLKLRQAKTKVIKKTLLDFFVTIMPFFVQLTKGILNV
jgi:hypothetical protein